MRRALPLLVLAAAGLSPGARAALPTPVPEVLEDGSEVVAVPLPAANWSSLRLVVRAGGAQDPESKSGLARLLGRTIVDGVVDERGTRLEEMVRRSGGRLTFRSTPTSTIYVLDAPSTKLQQLAGAVIANVTNPRLSRVDLPREVSFLNTEPLEPRGADMPWARLERLLFPPTDPNSPLDGTPSSREKIELDDLVAFYGKNYITTAVTAVFAGAISSEQAVALLDHNMRLPPALPEDRPAVPKLDPPNLPISEKQHGPVHFAAIGYRLDRGRRQLCDAFARIASGRMAVAVGRSRKAPWLEVQCLSLRGHDFLVASSPARAPDGYAFPDAVESAFKAAAKSPPKPREWSRIQEGAEHALELLAEDPASLADALASAASAARPPGSTARTEVSAVFFRPSLSWAQVKDLAKRSFREDRMFQMYLSPSPSQ